MNASDRFTEQQVDEMVGLYDRGWSMVDLGRKYIPDRSIRTTWIWIRRALRSRGRRIRHHGETHLLRSDGCLAGNESSGQSGSEELRLSPEVEAAAADIRRTWSDEEKLRRMTSTSMIPWVIPAVRVQLTPGKYRKYVD